MKLPAKPWLERTKRLLELGMQDQFRKRSFRRLLLGVAAVGALLGAFQAQNAAATAIWLSETLGRPAGLWACLWFGRYACRDLERGRNTVLRARAVDGAYLAGIQWATGICLWLLLLTPAFLAAALVQLPFSGLAALQSHFTGYVQTAITICAIGTVAFTLSRLLQSALGGLLTGAIWAVLVSGALPGLGFHPDYSQNSLLIAAGAAFLWSAALLLVERGRRGELRKPLVPAAIVVALFFAAAAAGARTLGQRTPVATGALWDGMVGQRLEMHQPLPGFWLPVGNHRLVRTADYPGQVLAVYLFAPGDLRSAQTLRALDQVQRQYSATGVQVIGIAVGSNEGSSDQVTALGGYRFPIATDQSATDTRIGKAKMGSVLLRAYRTEHLPLLVVTDRAHRVEAIRSEEGMDLKFLRYIVDERLSAEPGLQSPGGAR